MGKFIVRGTVYHEYSVEVVADSKDDAREKAGFIPLSEWDNNGSSGLDIWDTEEETND